LHKLSGFSGFFRSSGNFTTVWIDKVGSAEAAVVAFNAYRELIGASRIGGYMDGIDGPPGFGFDFRYEGFGRKPLSLCGNDDLVQVRCGPLPELGVIGINGAAEADDNHNDPAHETGPEMDVVKEFPGLLPRCFLARFFSHNPVALSKNDSVPVLRGQSETLSFRR